MRVSLLNRRLQHKMLLTATGKSCLNYEPTAKTLQACKSATYQKKIGHNSSDESESDGGE